MNKNEVFVALAIASLCVGCESAWVEPGGDPALIRPVLVDDSEVTTTEWNEAVHNAADAWNDLLFDMGCVTPPFQYAVLNSGHHPVRLVSPENWMWDDTWTGSTTPDVAGGPPGAIEIRSDAGDPNKRATFRYRAILLHELGHAMGLDHGDSPIMEPYHTPAVLSDDDGFIAADFLGC